MFSIRLPEELEKRIALLADRKQKTKSYIIKEAIIKYLEKEEPHNKSFELGKELFGQYGSGNGNLSTNYKKKVREKIHAKKSH
ncbi:MAG: ribbon-helix-helix domain-containing protein [Bacillota bacterium]